MKRLERADYILELITFGLLVLLSLFTMIVWNSLPDQLPVHFNAAGVADGWGSRGSAWIFPILGFLTCGTVFVASTVSDDFVNLPFHVKQEDRPAVCRPMRRIIHIINLECALLYCGLGLPVLLRWDMSPLFLWGMIAAIFGTTAVGIVQAWRIQKNK